MGDSPGRRFCAPRFDVVLEWDAAELCTTFGSLPFGTVVADSAPRRGVLPNKDLIGKGQAPFAVTPRLLPLSLLPEPLAWPGAVGESSMFWAIARKSRTLSTTEGTSTFRRRTADFREAESPLPSAPAPAPRARPRPRPRPLLAAPVWPESCLSCAESVALVAGAPGAGGGCGGFGGLARPVSVAERAPVLPPCALLVHSLLCPCCFQ
mmetsp:Transcript_96576/g.176877  ORF Transcript_96576/g.176877 Transcript_96576/m.176877 type:complete len:208 (-) Transcript_96576:409-1032(-)